MRAYVGELIGTVALVFGGCGAAVLAGEASVLPAYRRRSGSRSSPWSTPWALSPAVTLIPR